MSEMLEGIELLTVQYVLDGQNAGLGFRFRTVGMEKADFTGGRDDDILSTKLVQQAQQSGELRKVRFYIDLPNDSGENESVLIRLYEDGHLSSTKPVQTEIFDTIMHNVNRVLEIREYLTSLESLMREYIHNEFDFSADAKRDNHARRVHRAFEKIITDDLAVPSENTIDILMYQMALANIGIELLQTKNLSSNEYPNAQSKEDLKGYKEMFKEFHLLYRDHKIPQASIESDFSLVSDHLRRLIDNRSSYDSAVGMVEKYRTEYVKD